MILEITKKVKPPIGTFLLTCETKSEDIITHQTRVRTTTIQIVEALSEGSYHQIKSALPFIKLVQVIHVIDEASVNNAVRISEEVNALLLDSGYPNLAIKVLGGTGNTHNWKLSRKIVKQSRVPVFLAGGLKAENVKQAIDEVRPFGFDLCSSVRTEKNLDKKNWKYFLEPHVVNTFASKQATHHSSIQNHPVLHTRLHLLRGVYLLHCIFPSAFLFLQILLYLNQSICVQSLQQVNYVCIFLSQLYSSNARVPIHWVHPIVDLLCMVCI